MAYSIMRKAHFVPAASQSPIGTQSHNQVITDKLYLSGKNCFCSADKTGE
jgi:hypothetical protein